MTDNIAKVMERDVKLNTILDSTDKMKTISDKFARGSGQLRRTMWWKNVKFQIAIGVFLLVSFKKKSVYFLLSLFGIMRKISLFFSFSYPLVHLIFCCLIFCCFTRRQSTHLLFLLLVAFASGRDFY